MPLYTKESLERLRHQIDLIEVVSSHIDLKRSGASYKALCPFHEEKTPSFVVQRGDYHYHCFGCGAHGDAIEFLMTYLQLNFTQAVESLAEKFNVHLEISEQKGENRVNRAALKEALGIANQFFHCYLLHTQEGQEALNYLYKRKITLDFIRRFEIGLAPKKSGLMCKVMYEHKISNQVLHDIGLLKKREFFLERITFPIRDPMGSIIGFSARKYKEETFGGKYINTPETPLFKKSHILFGLNYCRRRIVKEKRAIIVEGQIDCLKLIEVGLNITIAALGTAFGERHVKQLQNLGVHKVYLIFDSDQAGKKAISKVGNLFQQVGVEVIVVLLPLKSDPDTFLAQYGPEKLIQKIKDGIDYLTFQVEHLSKEYNVASPAGKTELINTLANQIKQWEDPVMIHESLRKLAALTQVPEEIVGIRGSFSPHLYIKSASPLILHSIDPNRVLELDLLRWLILEGKNRPNLVEVASKHLKPSHFWIPICQKLFISYMKKNKPHDLLSLLIDVNQQEGQKCIEEILSKKINKKKAESLFVETVQKLLDRQWMHSCEEIKNKMQTVKDDDELIKLSKDFDALKKKRPKVDLP